MTAVIRLPRGRRIGGTDLLYRIAPQIQPPAQVVSAGVPYLPMVVAGAIRVQIAEHRVERKVERNMNAPVPRHHANCGTQSAARALAADHDPVRGEPSLPAHLYIQHLITVLHGCRIWLSPGQTVTGGVDRHAVFFYKIRRPAHIHHFLHAGDESASMDPQQSDLRLIHRSAGRRISVGTRHSDESFSHPQPSIRRQFDSHAPLSKQSSISLRKLSSKRRSSSSVRFAGPFRWCFALLRATFAM